MGRLLSKLDELELTQNTLLIFCTDHGEMLGNHGLTQKFVAYQESIRVPFFMHLPGKIPAGKVVHDPVNLLDMYATIFDYAGLSCPPQQGKSLRAVIEGKEHREYTFTEMFDWYSAYVSREWKFVWVHKLPGSSALYNLKDDPFELNNLIAKNPDRERSLPQVRYLRKKMLEWMEEVNHPLRDPLVKAEF
jgi:arylsulfatase A-like enzyme